MPRILNMTNAASPIITAVRVGNITPVHTRAIVLITSSSFAVA